MKQTLYTIHLFELYGIRKVTVIGEGDLAYYKVKEPGFTFGQVSKSTCYESYLDALLAAEEKRDEKIEEWQECIQRWKELKIK